jgi:hypothetical protein
MKYYKSSYFSLLEQEMLEQGTAITQIASMKFCDSSCHNTLSHETVQY